MPIDECNSRIKCIIKNANGYKNFDRFKKIVLFSINKKAPIRSNNRSIDKDNNKDNELKN